MSTEQNHPEQSPGFPVGTFCWNELNTSNTAAAGPFYTKLFGWETTEFSQGGMTCTLFRINENRIGGMVQNPEAAMPVLWLSYLRVADVDAVMARAVEMGAKVMIPPTDIPMVGRMAVFQDPQGAALGLFKP